MRWVNLTGPLLVLLASEADEVKLSATDGSPVKLAATFRGRPTVLFYEDRESTRLNQALKDALFAAGRASGFAERVSVVAVANVAAYDWFPARNLVTAAVRDLEKTLGLRIHLDWKGALTRPPWALQPTGSTVVVVDRARGVRFARCGRLENRDVEAVLALVEQLVRER